MLINSENVSIFRQWTTMIDIQNQINTSLERDPRKWIKITPNV